jgi:sulfur carrier protein
VKICVNGNQREIDAQMLDAVLLELGYGSAVVATAINGTFVATSVRSTTRLADGQQLEVVAPMQGG